MDFLEVEQQQTKNGIEIVPMFSGYNSDDLMIRGGKFYAAFDPETNLWVTNENWVKQRIDKELYSKAKEFEKQGLVVHVKTLKDTRNGQLKYWKNYTEQLCVDNFHLLNQNVIFANDEVKKEDYATFKLPYSISNEPCPNWDELVSTLYLPEERRKIEYAIGSIVSGKSKEIQKFYVLYGSAGTGKSTILNIISAMFKGYWSPFTSSKLASRDNQFALDEFSKSPLIGIDHEGDLSRLNDNSKLNVLVSHDNVSVNEKFKTPYEAKFNTILMIGTNKPVRITDAKSGLLRRLIDISPSGNTIPKTRYLELMKGIKFEYGQIAGHCLEVFNKNRRYYDSYTPDKMLNETNTFYNFMLEQYPLYSQEDQTSLGAAWNDYKEYCTDANIQYPMIKMDFNTELSNYFNRHETYGKDLNGVTRKDLYSGFKRNKFHNSSDSLSSEESIGDKRKFWLKFDRDPDKSEFDLMFPDLLAQYANDDGNPKYRWDSVHGKLSQIDPRQLHWVKCPPWTDDNGQHYLVIIDFDCTNEAGEKDINVNLQAVKDEWNGPPTYAEVSKSGQGIHLVYIYDGNASNLVDHIGEHIEVKVYKGNMSLRRKLTKCNDLPIAHISSGIPFKEAKKNVVNWDGLKNERMLRTMIKKNLNKEYHADTTESINYIKQLMDDAYEKGFKYDVSDLHPAISSFAMNSTNQAQNNLRTVTKMKFRSKDVDNEELAETLKNYTDDTLIFFDVEVFPNVFIVCWKAQGKKNEVIQMINPTSEDIRRLCTMKLIGFNNRDYDNHILYAWMQGYTNRELYFLSKRIIEGKTEAKIRAAYNLSYSDVYDFLAAYNKMSLKKWEVKLGIHHLENEYDWNSDLPKEHWQEVADYCSNDVRATEAVFDANQDDWLARLILADIAGMTPNASTNTLTGRIIFGDDKHPQDQFVYTDLSTIFPGYRFDSNGIDPKDYDPGVKIVSGKSIYRGEDPGEGGHKWARPGVYFHVGLFDVASMHPHSAIRLNIFGDKYTKVYEDLVNVRIDIKHHNHEKAETMFGGKLKKWLDNPDISDKKLANALKTAINSVYGLTSAHFDNLFKDPRNVDNIVAKYGALFMINLKHELWDMGYTVVHISTDSIKVANIDKRAYDFIMAYGKKYGFDFEFEAQYERMCLVNDSVYIAKVEKEDGQPVDPYWTATGKEFQIPYIFKTAFSHEPLEFNDYCTTMSVKTALYLDLNEGMPDVSYYEAIRDARNSSKKITKKLEAEVEANSGMSDKELNAKIAEGHNYHFIGRVGSFIPIKDGCGGGILLRQDAKDKHKFSAATGSIGYRWLESTMIKDLHKEDDIDLAYFEKQAEDAKEHISEFMDFEEFITCDAPQDLFIF